jgi:S-adenosylmethionine--tRNA ribosyltransferase-isomerase
LNHSIVAVGTTSVRTLETYARNLKREGETDIFIMPGEKFYLTDIMITNFHLPKTSLMLLVDAFLQNKNAKYSIVDLYKIAIKNDFCFYSFGDSMLIL